MIVEEKYLENRTTRNAFYTVRIVKNDKSKTRPFYIEVHWGALGTEGRTSRKKNYKDEMSARFDMQKLVEAKKMRHYHETRITRKGLAPVNQVESGKLSKLSKERFLSLEIE